MPTKPLIGITPQFNPERGGVWSLDSYVKAVRAAGGMPVKVLSLMPASS
jgi:hypothetical protein